ARRGDSRRGEMLRHMKWLKRRQIIRERSLRPAIADLAEEIQLRLELLLMVRLLDTLAHKLAQLARMLSIESLLQRRTERFGLRELYCHTHPGDRLQQCPMPSSRQHQHRDYRPLSQPIEHCPVS